ncbi:PREDICTED: probable LRR receptor-like serine/threonine-protein kinase RKF3 [Camelina sativa]|uniref:Probable LRR receptor-like serine/threonine-protein kinase RKF3 n=1 Tax=Camelina sativa TaxID=90675 RepID=A0ABM0YY86_CAMSA|nr:PREDICTED: probable LRR receptor-like serine/threonine-protein kinase RKF3 [Camelina sativa]XP_019101129.1 PREDICTED: probable LRR receptor-like serine/threonine-protein kinase RKF3 [Camelina sativa]
MLLLRGGIAAVVVLILFFSSFSSSFVAAQKKNSSSSSCPLDFSILQPFRRPEPDGPNTCQYLLQGLRLLYSNHLRKTGSFLPPAASAASCWDALQSNISDFLPAFDVRSKCGFKTPWISQGCMNITTRSHFESLIPNSSLSTTFIRCNTSLQSNTPCASCTQSLSAVQAYLNGPSLGNNVSDCSAFPSIYAAAFANSFGPTDSGTAKCLFQLDYASSSSGGHNNNAKKLKIAVSLSVSLVTSALGITAWLLYSRRLKKKKKIVFKPTQSRLDSMSESTTLVKFSFDEIKKATNNFSRHNIIGKGGYGNVYKGVLPDATQVAFKRFKNCSATGDENFAHEVEVIASIRHVNLLALRGYCTATTPYEGHQRIIVCDLVTNGSLHDHLFGDLKETQLSWPLRQRIALGMARGLAYLHYGAQPSIIHRDIKASNILLDERFEAKVADFGLAKFNPEGMTHMSTRVAGTMGYVAPEYALYGQLTEKSDVYSFGVVLLELLSRRKAIVTDEEGQPVSVADWAWSLVREGRTLDVVEDGMPEKGPPEVLEKYVLIAVLCSHPQLHARPTMDQVVKMLENNEFTVISIPQRPIPLVACRDEIDRSVSSSSGSGKLTSPTGYQAFSFGGDDIGPSGNTNMFLN